jgi:hypothetical protein
MGIILRLTSFGTIVVDVRDLYLLTASCGDFGGVVLRYDLIESNYGVQLRTSPNYHIHMRVIPIPCI